MDEKLLQMLSGSEADYPKNLEKRYLRVLNRIVELWYSPKIDDYFTELLVDIRGDRQGFPHDVAAELFNLSQIHARLRGMAEQSPNSTNPWNDAEESNRVAIERHGYDFTPKGFLKSAEKSDYKALILFLGSGVDIDTRDGRGWTPLMMSCFNGNEEIALLLIQHSADIHAKDSGGYGSLHWAAFNGYGNVVKLLIEKGADVNERSNHGWTPLLQAATRGHLVAAGQLIAGGANVNLATDDGWTPLHKAAANGHAEMVKLLLSKGANRNAAYRDGTKPVDLAIKGGHEKIVALIEAIS